MNLLKNCFWLLAVASLVSNLPTQAAQAPAIWNEPSVFPPGMQGSGQSLTIVGWTFEVRSPVVATGLAWYDAGRDGLLGSHQVGLWKETTGGSLPFMPSPSNLTMLASLTISSGTSAQLVGSWRKLDFEAALTLQPGLYEIAGTEQGSPRDSVVWASTFDVIPVLLDERISMGVPAFHLSPSQLEPGNDFLLAYGAMMGPMLFIEQVPEPSASLLAVVGAGAAMFVRVRRGRKS